MPDLGSICGTSHTFRPLPSLFYGYSVRGFFRAQKAFSDPFFKQANIEFDVLLRLFCRSLSATELVKKTRSFQFFRFWRKRKLSGDISTESTALNPLKKRHNSVAWVSLPLATLTSLSGCQLYSLMDFSVLIGNFKSIEILTLDIFIQLYSVLLM